MIHGLSIPAIVWKDVAPRLAANGYRVLLYGWLYYNRMLQIGTLTRRTTHRSLWKRLLGCTSNNLPPWTVLDSTRLTHATSKVGQGYYCGCVNGTSSVFQLVRVALTFGAGVFLRFIVLQGGGVAAAFTAHFPQLVDEKVVLIASAGLIEVCTRFFARVFRETCVLIMHR